MEAKNVYEYNPQTHGVKRKSGSFLGGFKTRGHTYDEVVDLNKLVLVVDM